MQESENKQWVKKWLVTECTNVCMYVLCELVGDWVTIRGGE